VGGTANEFTQDALGNRVVRAITAIAGRVRKGDSGGPVIDTHGKVEATIFAKTKASRNGFAVPTSIDRTDLAEAGQHAVSTESCAP
jgi:S1-C subfamily serine protease